MSVFDLFKSRNVQECLTVGNFHAVYYCWPSDRATRALCGLFCPSRTGPFTLGPNSARGSLGSGRFGPGFFGPGLDSLGLFRAGPWQPRAFSGQPVTGSSFFGPARYRLGLSSGWPGPSKPKVKRIKMKSYNQISALEHYLSLFIWFFANFIQTSSFILKTQIG